MLSLRPSQEEIMRYAGGRMGISAVPGSGKTWTLSLLAADIVRSGVLAEDQEVLVVTLVNSAVDNFYQRVGSFVRLSGLLPNLGYRVRTLHGLAHDIVRERPGLVGLEEGFQIIDEREADSILNEIVNTWLNAHPGALMDYLDPELEEKKFEWILREKIPSLIQEIARSFIRSAKDRQITPKELHQKLNRLPMPLLLAEMGYSIYEDYQRALVYRGGVDFDDLIRLALRALESDPQYLARLQKRWPYILEDEAQDSSRLQEEILHRLVGEEGNWVRVGDPNQAIYETFTTANPRYLRDFMARKDVILRQLPESGRSTYSIIRLANHLVEWAQSEHPVQEVRDALSSPPYIEMTSPDDPQPNPPDNLSEVHLVVRKFTAKEEIGAVVDSLARWLPENRDQTVAVLVPLNKLGFQLVDVLQQRKIEYDDSMLRSSSSTRLSAGALGNLLRYLTDPQSSSKLATVYKVWRRAERKDDESRHRIDRTAELIRKIGKVEDYIWPKLGQDWLGKLADGAQEGIILEELEGFRKLVRRWLGATLLPVDQIVLTIAQDLLTDPSELAVSHKLAVLLRRASYANPTWRLPDLTEELVVIARNERRFLGFSQDDTGFDPEKHRGKVIVATMHKAKGLEWDRVYLMSVNNYDFPSGLPGDSYIPEKWYLRQNVNLDAEALAQLESIFSIDEYWWYQEGEATERSRLDYARERLRLLYVGITRARKELIITYNTGQRGNMLPALPFVALKEWWQTQ
jgi:DNA helicase-2/ATP-dependent DNA helicase PcrA